nr:hypothetical protein [Tanacetum cinerariifolium]
MESNDGLGGRGFVVVGGRFSSVSKSVWGEVRGVENKSLVGYKFMAIGEDCLDGWVRPGRGGVKGDGVSFGVSRILLGEIPEDIMRGSGGEAFGFDGGADYEVNSELAVFTEACQAAYEASKPKVHRTPVEKDHYDAHDRLVMAYFSEHPQYDEATFQRYDCTGQRSISALMKCTSAICQMAYGAVPDSLDEYLQMGATTTRDSL